MNLFRLLHHVAASIVLACALLPAQAADFPAPKEGTWVARDFKFHTGEVMPELKLHYTTVGAPSGEPVLILHGTGGSGTGMLNPAFAGELFGPGQPLDASKYFIILPDAIGAGKSSKPSDGLRAKFPKYNYDDMWCSRSTASSPKAWACATCAWCSATRWAACTRGCGAPPTPASWTRWCPWLRSPPRWRAATG